MFNKWEHVHDVEVTTQLGFNSGVLYAYILYKIRESNNDCIVMTMEEIRCNLPYIGKTALKEAKRRLIKKALIYVENLGTSGGKVISHYYLGVKGFEMERRRNWTTNIK